MISQQRNPLTFPIEVFKNVLKKWRVSANKPKLTLRLGDHVHPSLSEVADSVEYFIHRFQFALETTLVRTHHDNMGSLDIGGKVVHASPLQTCVFLN